jgi:iron complex outermembrane receptor protein
MQAMTTIQNNPCRGSDMHTLQSARSVARTGLATAIAAALALLLPTGAQAQQQAQGESQAAEQDQAARNPEVTTLETVLVTANKRVENIREVASSISVVGEAQLENLHATQLTDISAYVPGLQVTSSGTPGQTAISLRGIAPISPGANIGTYIDETPVGSSGFYQRQTAFALDLLPYDIARIEVLRGPQGTLYGAGAMGGLLKYVTVDPDPTRYEFRFGGGVSDVAGGSDPGWDVRLGANLPLVTDRLALRVGYARNALPGYIDNAGDGRQDINEGTQESVRAALLWQASEAVSLELSAMRQNIDSDDNALVALDPATLRPLFGDLTNITNLAEPFSKDIDFFAATLDWDLGWADFVSASSYSKVATDQRSDGTFVFGELPMLFGLPAGIAYLDLGLDLEKFTQELRLSSKASGRFEWQLGLFYTDEDADNSQILRLQTVDGTSYAGLDPLFVAALPSTFKETAIFANATYDVTDRFELGAGLRFARNEQAFTTIIEPGSPIVPPAADPGDSREDVFTWHLAPKFKLTDDAMLYARIATGYQPGGPNVTLPNIPPTVDASRTTNYELGLKSEFANHRVQFDLALFRIDWKDIQVSAGVGGVTFLTNGGKAVSQGAELSALFRPTERLQLGLNTAYTDATLSEDAPLVGGFRTGLKDDRLPYIPEWSWSATADYSFPLRGSWDARVGAGLRWVGERESSLTETNPFAAPAPKLDSYPALDLNADASNGRWTLRAYVKNVTDERAYQAIGAVQSAVTGVTSHLLAAPIQPRTVGIEVDYRY